MVAYKMPQQRKKEENERLREREIRSSSLKNYYFFTASGKGALHSLLTKA